jgi:hypothetical protein
MAITLAEILRQFVPEYRSRYPSALLPSHERAIRDILCCRTPALGGHLWHCPQCDREVYVYHACRNRACPACHADQTQKWLVKRQGELLPCDYFHCTATVPEGLRGLFRSNQKLLYALLMRLTAQCIQDVAANPKHLGAMPGILAVLHTWTGTLLYHPHVHCLVTAGGTSPDGTRWLATKPGFFLPVRVLSRHLRTLFQKALQQRPELYAQVPAKVWQQEWVVHCIPWGNGQRGVLEYLARYVFRVAISERRLLRMDAAGVSFAYKDRTAKQQKTCQLAGVEFIRRFLQHILPKGFHKVRYFGLWHPRRKALAQQVRVMLQLKMTSATLAADDAHNAIQPAKPFKPTCPNCGCQDLQHVRELPRQRPTYPIRGP